MKKKPTPTYKPLEIITFPHNLLKSNYKSWLHIRMGTKKTSFVVVLPTPANLSFNTNIMYNDVSLGVIDSVFDSFTESLQSGKGLLESGADAAMGLFNNTVNSDFAKSQGVSTQLALASSLFKNLKIQTVQQFLEPIELLARKELRDQGVAVNPNTELYFQDVGLRSFTFSFKLMAKNLLDSDAIMQIVKTFEYVAHPEKKNNVLYSYPDECILTFFDGDNVNNNIPAINRCVIKSFSHAYNSDSGVFFENGMPSSVDISITFQETSVNTRETINRTQDDTERRKFSKRKDPKGDGIDINSGDIIAGLKEIEQKVKEAAQLGNVVGEPFNTGIGLQQNENLDGNLKNWGMFL